MKAGDKVECPYTNKWFYLPPDFVSQGKFSTKTSGEGDESKPTPKPGEGGGSKPTPKPGKDEKKGEKKDS